MVPLFLWSPTVTHRSYPTKPVNPDRSPFNKMFPAVNICMVKLQMVIVVVVVVMMIKNFSVRFLSVLRGHSVFSSPTQRPMTYDFEGFLYQILSITLFFYLNVFGMTRSLTGIEPEISHTRSQHSTTRLSRRRYD